MDAPVSRRPWQAEAAFWCYIAAAAVAVIVGVLLVSVLPAAIQVQHLSTAAEQGRLITVTWTVLAIVGVWAVGVIVLALLLRARRWWARVPLVVLSATSIFAIAGLGAIAFALCVAAGILVFWRPVGPWLRGT